MAPVSANSAAAAAASAAAQPESKPAPKKRTRASEDAPSASQAQGSNLKKARTFLTLAQTICSAPVEDIPLILRDDRLAIEMTAITALYTHCVALEDDRPLAPYSKEGLWEVQFGAPYDVTDNIHALISITKQYGCMPSDIPADRLAFINDGFLDAMVKIEAERTGLILSDMQLILLPPRLWECENLEVLDLDDNALAVLPNEIEGLYNLTRLSLSGNLLRTLPSLPNLKVLTIVENPLVHLPEALKACETLKVLEIACVQLVELSEWVGELSQLRRLYLYGNELTDLPQELARLAVLKILNIEGNQFVARPAVLAQLPVACQVFADEHLPDDSGAAAAAPE